MYSTCLFCHETLGRNEAIERFPIGRRLAFDAEKGRLWAICGSCSRWNLTPLEERWEAIEECERLFRAQRLRAQTEHIGLARLKEGTELVRVGRPQRPEFAAWRYGRLFGRRFHKRAALVGAGASAAATGLGASMGLLTGLEQLGAVAIPVAWFGFVLVASVAGPFWQLRGRLPHLLVPRAGQRPYVVSRVDIKESNLALDSDRSEWVLNFRYLWGLDVLRGDAARRALGILLTRVNSAGATSGTTQSAAARIAAAGGPETFLTELASRSQALTGDYLQRRANFRRTGRGNEQEWSSEMGPVNRGALPFLLLEDRLALEMSVHEDEERRALEGEIGPLEEAWKEAESIAAIADDLLTSAKTREFIATHRTGGHR